ncbi:MAG: GNAT family N-acetyltransferase [Alkalinema sp. RU_4_3]|nr:GNAT family N-acetyltransferase [Alkalinema sp. RU_4_3]
MDSDAQSLPAVVITDLAQVVAAQSDLPSIAGLLVRNFQLYPPGMGWLTPVIQRGVLEDLRQRLRNAGKYYGCYRAVLGAEIVGTAELSLRPVQGRYGWLWQGRSDRAPYLANLAVEQSSRRRSVARQLMATCEQQAQAWGYGQIYLTVMADNQAARSLYGKAGYEIVRRDRGWLWLGEKLLMRKALMVDALDLPS